MNLDSSVVKLIILFIPGVIGITLLDLFFVPKIKWSFQEKVYYSIILGIISYLPEFNTLKTLINTNNPLGMQVTICFIMKAICISAGSVIILLSLNNSSKFKVLDSFFQYFGGNLIDEKKNLLDVVYKNNELKKFVSYFVIVRVKDGNCYIGFLEAYNFKEIYIELFLSDVDWYKPNNYVDPYLSFKSIFLTFKITDITLEFMEESNE